MKILALLLPLCLGPTLHAADFAQTEFKDSKGTVLRYAILKPAMLKPETKYPLVVSLHGAGGRGKQKWVVNCAANKALSQPAMRQTYPCYIIAPTVGRDQRWDGAPLAALMELIKSSLNEHAIDPARIYVTGQSMGGAGTYSAILAEPNLFAAAVPVCGRGQPYLAKKIVHIPIWIFHGELDRVVPTQHSRDMNAALKKAGGKPTYTEYAGVRHNSWTAAYADKKLWKWLFAQKRGAKVLLDDPEAKVIITDPIVEKEIRRRLKKPKGELTKVDLGKMRGLELSRTRITDSSLKEVAKLKGLNFLSLYESQIIDTSLKDVAKLKQLKTLFLTGCNVTDTDLKEVAKLENITTLFLRRNTKITDVGLKEVAKLQQLTTLFVGGTKITDAGLKDVAKLQKLKSLSVNNTQITDEGLKEVDKLQQLTSLSLNFTQITDAGLKEVDKLQQLTELNLSFTQITDAGLKELPKLKKLSFLSLENTKVTKAGVAQLQKALPKCEIYSNAKE